MDILKFLKNELIEELEINSEIIEVSKVGSVLYCSKPHDNDYLVLCRNYTQKKNNIKIHEDGQYYDFFIYDIEEYRKKLSFSTAYRGLGTFSMYHNVQEVLKERVFGDAKNDWNFFQYEQEYSDLLDDSIYSLAFDQSRKYAYVTGKNFVIPYIVIKFVENRNTILTKEMRKDIEQLRKGSENFLDIISWIGNKFGYSLVSSSEEFR